MKGRWMEAFALVLCLVTIVLIVASRNPDCVEVCAEAGMVAADRDQGCAVACFCRTTPKRGHVEFEVHEAWGTRLEGTVELGFGLRMNVLVKLPGIVAPDPNEEPEARELSTAFLRALTVGKFVYIDARGGANVRDGDGYWVQHVVVVDTYDKGLTNLVEYMVDKGYARDCPSLAGCDR